MRIIYRVHYGVFASCDFNNYNDAYYYAFLANAKRAQMNPRIEEIEILEYKD